MHKKITGRRNFICNFLKAGLIFGGSNVFSNGIISLNNSIEDDYLELIGLKSPIICGDYYLLKEQAFEALSDMKNDAAKEGLKIWCTSGYRNFEYQKNIWNAKFKNFVKEGLSEAESMQKVMQFTALPGTSRHHWGTDFDLVDASARDISNPLSEEEFTDTGEFAFLNYWLNKNAAKYEIYQVYDNEQNRGGIAYEPWHYSYKSLSKEILKKILQFDFSSVKEYKLCKGFEMMDKTFFENYKTNFIKNINKNLI